MYMHDGGGIEQFVKTTGIKQKRICTIGQTSSDLCFASSNRLIDELGWQRNEIDILVFVTQTPDYHLPSTSCILQEKLGLSSDCYTLDISLGCSGWVYAVSVISSLMQTGGFRKGLLLAGDTILSRFCSADDKSTYPLFGDAGTCTAFEYDRNASPFYFAMHTDGSGSDVITVNDGGARHPEKIESFAVKDHGDGIRHSNLQLSMEGMTVFTFGISKAPKVINELLVFSQTDKDNIDVFSFHQANLFMNEKIRKKLKLTEEQVPYCLDEFGNTSCASIPLTLVTRRANMLKAQNIRHVACGFGVGLSWGAVRFDTNNIVIPELIEI